MAHDTCDYSILQLPASLTGHWGCCVPQSSQRLIGVLYSFAMSQDHILDWSWKPSTPAETLPPDADLETFSSSLKMVEIRVDRDAKRKDIETQPKNDHNQQHNTTTPSLTEQDSQKTTRRSNKARKSRPPQNDKRSLHSHFSF